MTSATSITVRVPLAIRHRPGRKTIVTPMVDGVARVTTRADPTLVKALARAFRYQRMLDDGRYASITEMAAAERLERGYLGSLLRLTLLAPEIVQAILDGQQLEGVTLPRLLEPLSTEWPAQRIASTTNPHGAAALANGQQGVLADEPPGARDKTNAAAVFAILGGLAR